MQWFFGTTEISWRHTFSTSRFPFKFTHTYTLARIHNLDQHLPNKIVQNDKITIKLTNRFVATHTRSRFFHFFSCLVSSILCRCFFVFYRIIWMVLNVRECMATFSFCSQEMLSSLASNQSVYSVLREREAKRRCLIKSQTINFQDEDIELHIELLVDWCSTTTTTTQEA